MESNGERERDRSRFHVRKEKEGTSLLLWRCGGRRKNPDEICRP